MMMVSQTNLVVEVCDDAKGAYASPSHPVAGHDDDDGGFSFSEWPSAQPVIDAIRYVRYEVSFQSFLMFIDVGMEGSPLYRCSIANTGEVKILRFIERKGSSLLMLQPKVRQRQKGQTIETGRHRHMT